ncbi:MAG: S1-like domain-containing RNA-binding protein [Lachnospiraceae bacterium]|nr:S1-like domain-containing RNA-binding protein [Lachnospiraceae bacterium]
MIEIGRKQTLTVVKKTDFGVYLNEGDQDDGTSVLLPRKQVPKGAEKGTQIPVFIYRDSSDRLIATTREPKLTLGECALLPVVQITKIGAFLDWGLEKDLLLPYKEQTTKVRQGRQYLVCLYEDKSHRLCATMKLYHRLSTDSEYKAEDHVEGTVYEVDEQYGAYVAVDNRYSGRIAKKELHQPLSIGQSIRARVIKVQPDGKLDLSLSEKAHVQMDVDAALVMDTIASYDGVLPFTDKAKPEVIERELGLSKNAFKRAVGRLLKQGKIEIQDTCIRIIK